ncbi:MAG: DUF896 domain-containing protein [Ectobacillus sp.]
MLTKEKLDRINALANKAKTTGLTKEELQEQKVLRQEYLKAFRGNFLTHLKSVKVVDDKGNDITPAKLKLLKQAGNGLLN